MAVGKLLPLHAANSGPHTLVDRIIEAARMLTWREGPWYGMVCRTFPGVILPSFSAAEIML